jgi:hypothetical protein
MVGLRKTWRADDIGLYCPKKMILMMTIDIDAPKSGLIICRYISPE